MTGLMLGPSAPGTTLMFLFNTLGSRPGIYPPTAFVRGGMSNLVNALASEAQSRGAEILTGRRVCEIRLETNRATGVMLEDGTLIEGKIILSNANPQHTFFDLVGAKFLEVEFVRDLKKIRYRGSLTRLIFGLADLPRFRSAIYRESEMKEGTLLSGHITICPDLEYLERAYDDAKYGRPSMRPMLDIAIPTILDPSRAPKGKHLMLVNAQYTPSQLETGTWEEERIPFLDRVVNLIGEYAPGFDRLIEAQAMLTPGDMEECFGLPGGCIHHGQMTLDQLFFMRPVPGYANYRTPVENLYLCGASTHPGGGVTGLPGYHAARTAIKDLSSGKK
jgi:phytoene dehydrogenase-like protein